MTATSPTIILKPEGKKRTFLLKGMSITVATNKLIRGVRGDLGTKEGLGKI